MIIPSNTVVGEPFKAIVAALDRFQNLAFDYTGKVVLYRGDRKLTELSFTPEDGGLQHAMLTLEEPGTVYLRAVDMDRDTSAAGCSSVTVSPQGACRRQQPHSVHSRGIQAEFLLG